METKYIKTGIFSAAIALFSGTLNAAIDISLTPTTPWNVGTGGVVDEVSPAYNIQNKGESVRLNIRGTDTASWHLSNIPGVNTYVMKWNVVSGKSDNNWQNIYTSDTSMFTTLGVNETKPFYLRYLSPAYITKGQGVTQTTTLKFTAVSPYIGTWLAKNINPNSRGDSTPFLVAESGTQLHIFYVGSNHLRYSDWDGLSEFAYTNVDPIEMYIGGVKSVLDSNKIPHIFYSGFGVVTRERYLRYASRNTDGTWTITDVDSGDASQDMTADSVILDANNRPHVLYRKLMNGYYSVKYKFFNGTLWEESEDIRQGAQVKGAVLGLDPEGKPYAAFIEAGDSAETVGLNFASRDNTAKTWSVKNIYSARELSGELVFAINAQNVPYIVYKDDQKNTLELARTGKTAAWEFSTISIGGEGQSLALDPSGYPNVAYIDNSELKYIQWTGVEWLPPVTIDSPENSPQSPSLSFDISGRPHIAYIGGSEGFLKYALWQ